MWAGVSFQLNTPHFAISLLQSRDAPLLVCAEPKAGLKMRALVPLAHVAGAGEPAKPWTFAEQMLREVAVPPALSWLRLATLLYQVT